MKIHRIAFAIALLAVPGLSACTHVVNFKPVKPPEEVVTQSDASVKLYMRPELIQSSHSFRSMLSGIANKWAVNYGARAHEFAVEYLSAAFRDFEEVSEPGTGADANLEIKHLHYTVSGQAAHVTMDVEATDATAAKLLSEHYATRGWRGTGVVFVGGVFAQKGVTRSSSDQAFKEIFLKLIDDLRAALEARSHEPEHHYEPTPIPYVEPDDPDDPGS